MMVLLGVTRLFFLVSTVNDWLVEGWLICRSRSSVRYLTQIELLIRSVHMIRHSTDINMLLHRDWS